jgi:hypothetical protein
VSLSAARAEIDSAQIGNPNIFSALLRPLAVLVGDPNIFAPAIAALLTRMIIIND